MLLIVHVYIALPALFSLVYCPKCVLVRVYVELCPPFFHSFNHSHSHMLLLVPLTLFSVFAPTPIPALPGPYVCLS